MSITIKVETVKVLEGGKEEVTTKELEGKLNYYAVEAATKFYDGVNAQIKADTGEEGQKNLLDAYNNIVISGSYSHIREVLWFMFKDPQNGGLTLENIERFLNERMDGGEDEFDDFVNEVLETMESSGFFMKQIRQNLKALHETILPQMEMMVRESTKETEKITGRTYYDQLSLIIIRGTEKGFFQPTVLDNVENSAHNLALLESGDQA